MTVLDRDNFSFLRTALYANVLFSTFCGILFLLGGSLLAVFLGKETVAQLGISLLVFAEIVYLVARRRPILGWAAWVIVILDVLWSVETISKAASGAFSPAGAQIFVFLSAVVLSLAAAQVVGIRRSREAVEAI